QAGVDAAGEQKLRVLRAAVVVHAAARVPALLIARIQFVVLGRPRQFRHKRAQRLMAAPRTSLAAVGSEMVGVDAYGHTSPATVAMRPIRKQAATPKTLFDQL